MIDDGRFEHEWRAHGAAVLRYCRFAAGSAETGEDIAAETFARFLKAGDRVNDDKVEAWLFTVARNLARSHHRRRTRWLAVLPELQAQSEDRTVMSDETELAALLAPLNAAERLAIYLRVVEGRPFGEVARMVRKSEAATKKTVYRALERLRHLEGQDARTVAQAGGVQDG